MKVQVYHKKNKNIVFDNLKWLLSENVFGMIIAMVASAVTARYLGTEKNGIINYCLTLVGLWSCTADLGITSIMQKEFSLNHVKRETLLGTGIFLCIVGGVFTTIGSIITVVVLGETIEIILCTVIISTSYILKCTYIFKFYFLGTLQSEKFVKSNLIVQMCVTIIKIIFVLAGCNIYFFATVYVIEALLQGVFYAIQYLKVRENRKKWDISFGIMKKILKQSMPNIIASAAVVIYMKSDQLMIGRMLDASALGVYAVAVQLAEVGNFVAVAMANTYLPVIVNKSKEKWNEFINYYTFYIEKMLLLALGIIVVINCCGPIAIYFLYGKEYIAAIPVMQVYSLCVFFVFIGMAEGAYVNIMQLQKQSMITTCIAAVVNIVLNFILIPRLGGMGAAVASVIAYSIQAVWTWFLWPDLSEFRKCIFNSFLFKNIRQIFKKKFLNKGSDL